MTNRKHPELFATFGLALVLVACPAPKMPEGPPPEYEDPPAPSWYGGDAGGGDAATEAPSTDDGASAAPDPVEPQADASTN